MQRSADAKVASIGRAAAFFLSAREALAGESGLRTVSQLQDDVTGIRAQQHSKGAAVKDSRRRRIDQRTAGEREAFWHRSAKPPN